MYFKRINILGVPVDCVDLNGALEAVESMLTGDSAETVLAINPEKVIRARRDPELLSALWSAKLLIPDGIGVVVAAWLLGSARMTRVPGAELMPAICAHAAQRGHKVYLYGASPEVNAKAADFLGKRFPDLRIVGRSHGFVPDDQMQALVDNINKSGAQILFVGLGSPRQELWLKRHTALLTVKVCQGVGGTFDVLAGTVKRAPVVFQRFHLEWFYRLVSNPKRLARQTNLLVFAKEVIKERFRK